jgi:hypothetical protein
MQRQEGGYSQVFKALTDGEVGQILIDSGADQLPRKERWLLVESGTYSGLIKVTYYVKNKNRMTSLRLGLTAEGWAFAPMQPIAPDSMATADIRQCYAQQRQKFEADIKEFQEEVARAFSSMENNIELMKQYDGQLEACLFEKDFSLEGLVKPSREQASQKYVIFSDLKLDSDFRYPPPRLSHQ